MDRKPGRKFTLTELAVIISVAVLISVLMAVCLPSARERARRKSCASSLRAIGCALRMYSHEYHGMYPDGRGRRAFEMLRSGGYLENVRIYTCPSTTDNIPDYSDLTWANVSYMYAAGLCKPDSIDSAIMRDRGTNHRKYGNILFIDGHVSGYSGADWTKNANKALFSY